MPVSSSASAATTPCRFLRPRRSRRRRPDGRCPAARLARPWSGREPVTIIDPRPPANIQAVIDAHGIATNPAKPAIADVLIVAVKPQIADEVMPLVATSSARRRSSSRSWPARPSPGSSRSSARRRLSSAPSPTRPPPLVAASPGLPAIATVNGRPALRRRAPARGRRPRRVAAAEEWIDIVTAVSGSGPAYVFFLAETLARAGAAAGLPRTSRRAWPARLWRGGRADAPFARHRAGDAAPERHVAERHHPCRAAGADGRRASTRPSSRPSPRRPGARGELAG